jgi:hypothetical protein
MRVVLLEYKQDKTEKFVWLHLCRSSFQLVKQRQKTKKPKPSQVQAPTRSFARVLLQADERQGPSRHSRSSSDSRVRGQREAWRSEG